MTSTEYKEQGKFTTLQLNGFDLHPNEKQLLTHEQGSTVRLWDIQTKNIKKYIKK